MWCCRMPPYRSSRSRIGTARRRLYRNTELDGKNQSRPVWPDDGQKPEQKNSGLPVLDAAVLDLHGGNKAVPNKLRYGALQTLYSRVDKAQAAAGPDPRRSVDNAAVSAMFLAVVLCGSGTARQHWDLWRSGTEREDKSPGAYAQPVYMYVWHERSGQAGMVMLAGDCIEEQSSGSAPHRSPHG